MLTKKDILSKNELKKTTVTVPAWGGDVCVSEMTAATRDKWEQELIRAIESGKHLDNARATLAAITVVDKNGDLLFTDEDIPALGKLSANVLEDIVSAARKLNKLSGDIEEAKKN